MVDQFVETLSGEGFAEVLLGSCSITELRHNFCVMTAGSQGGRRRADELDPAALRRARIRNGLQQKELAQMVGIAASALSEVEHGKRGISPAVRKRLAELLNCDPITFQPIRRGAGNCVTAEELEMAYRVGADGPPLTPEQITLLRQIICRVPHPRRALRSVAATKRAAA